MKLVVLTLSITYAASLRIRNEGYPKEGIVGGGFTDITNFPFQAIVEYYGNILCSASIISDAWLLSTAYALTNVTDALALRVRTGTSFLGRLGKVSSIKRIIPHPSFNSTTFYNDISLIELEEPIRYSEKQKPIPIAHSNESPKRCQEVITSGFSDPWNNISFASILRVAELNVVCNTKCEKTYLDTHLTKKMFCTESSSGFLSIEDSGSPGVIKKKLYGIVSSGFHGTALNVFTKLSKYYHWIIQQTGLNI